MDKQAVKSIIEGGMSVLNCDAIHAAARLWLAGEVRARRVVRFTCPYTGGDRYGMAELFA